MYMLKRFGFGARWCRWMEAIVFESSMRVLVNEILTKEFYPLKGVMQGDPLSPFLFVMATEGLKGLMNNAVSR